MVFFKIFNKMFFKNYFLMDIELFQLSYESTNPSQMAHLLEILMIHLACSEYLMIPFVFIMYFK